MTRSVNRRRPAPGGKTGRRRSGDCASSRPPRRHAALRCFGVPTWRSRSVRHVRGDMGPLLTSPAVRLRWPPSGEHAAASARLRSSRPHDSAPAGNRGVPAPPAKIGSPSEHPLLKRSRSLHPAEHQPRCRPGPRRKYGLPQARQLRLFPTATKTRRAALFRRALVDLADRAAHAR